MVSLTETFFCLVLILLKMSIFLELRFDRNLNIYKVFSFEDFQICHSVLFKIVFTKRAT